MISVQQINHKAKAFKNSTKRDPRFIIMDLATYKAFNQSLKPIERIQYFGECNPEEQVNLTKLHVTGYVLEFLIIDRKKPFCDIVG